MMFHWMWRFCRDGRQVDRLVGEALVALQSGLEYVWLLLERPDPHPGSVEGSHRLRWATRCASRAVASL